MILVGCVLERKDFVSVSDGGQRKHVQKRLLLCTCKEAYHQFKKSYPLVKIGISLFTSLKPREVINLGGTSHITFVYVNITRI